MLPPPCAPAWPPRMRALRCKRSPPRARRGRRYARALARQSLIVTLILRKPAPSARRRLVECESPPAQRDARVREDWTPPRRVLRAARRPPACPTQRQTHGPTFASPLSIAARSGRARPHSRTPHLLCCCERYEVEARAPDRPSACARSAVGQWRARGRAGRNLRTAMIDPGQDDDGNAGGRQPWLELRPRWPGRAACEHLVQQTSKAAVVGSVVDNRRRRSAHAQPSSTIPAARPPTSRPSPAAPTGPRSPRADHSRRRSVSGAGGSRLGLPVAGRAGPRAS